MSGPTPFSQDGLPLFTEERPAVVILGDLLDYIQEMRELYDDTQELYQVLQNNLSFIGSGSPKGVYPSLSALQTAKPTGDTFIYVTTDNGNWYYWNGSAWTSGGLYQGLQISNNSITNEKIGYQTIAPNKMNFIKNSLNLFNKDDDGVIVNKFIRYDGNIEILNGFSISGKIFVKPNDLMCGYFNPNSLGSNAKVYFFDENNQFVESVNPVFYGQKGSFRVPLTPSIKYLKFNYETNDKNIVMVLMGEDYPSVYTPFYYTLTDLFMLNESQKNEVLNILNENELNNELKDKNVVFDGDSICNAINDPMDGWAGRIATKNNMSYTNYAVDGGTITAGLLADGNPRHWISRSVNGYRPDADYIILEGGTNDADLIGVSNMGSISVGFNEILDDTNFTGAVENTLRQAILKYPNKKIGFIIAHKMGSISQQPIRRTFFERIIECCEKWGIPYLDLWEKSYINPELNEIRNLYYSDDQHLKTTGYELITPLIEKWMRTL